MIRDLELSAPLPDLWGGERGQRLRAIPSGQRMNNHTYVTKPPLKKKKKKKGERDIGENVVL